MNSWDELQIGGVEKFSASDWPGRLVTTVFCQGCGWRCRYCHRPELQPFRPPGSEAAGRDGLWRWRTVLTWMRERRGLIDGVVFSGGEATLQPGLAAAMREAKQAGFRVGLHTGGPVPDLLAEVLPLVDWVGFDFKAPFGAYAKVTGRHAGAEARASLALVRAAGVACEVRTTWHPALLSEAELAAMADALRDAGCTRWVVQSFRPEGCTDAELCASAACRVPSMVFTHAGLTVSVR